MTRPYPAAEIAFGRRATGFPRTREFVAADGVMVQVVECDARAGAWSRIEQLDAHGLVIARGGGYRRRLNERIDYIGPSMAFFENAGADYQLQHVHDEGHALTMLFFSDAAVVRMAGDAHLPHVPILMSGRLDMAHRQLIASLEAGLDPIDSEERVVNVIGLLIGAVAPERRARWAATERDHARLVDSVREAIVADPRAGLLSLAALVGYSPFHVSRVFHRRVGITLTGFRNRIRAAMVLDRLENGERDLAGLALQLGFFDQAHMTRVVRSELGAPPGSVRQLLTPFEQRPR